MLDVAQPLMAAAPRFVSALLSGFAAPAPHPTIRGFAAYFNAYKGRWSVPAFRPITDKLTVWTGAVAALSIGTPGSLAGYGASEAHACRLPRFSSTSTRAQP